MLIIVSNIVGAPDDTQSISGSELASSAIHEFYVGDNPASTDIDIEDIRDLASDEKQCYDNFNMRYEGLTKPFNPKFTAMVRYLTSKRMYDKYRLNGERKTELEEEADKIDCEIYGHLHAMQQINSDKFDEVSYHTISFKLVNIGYKYV